MNQSRSTFGERSPNALASISALDHFLAHASVSDEADQDESFDRDNPHSRWALEYPSRWRRSRDHSGHVHLI